MGRLILLSLIVLTSTDANNSNYCLDETWSQIDIIPNDIIWWINGLKLLLDSIYILNENLVSSQVWVCAV